MGMVSVAQFAADTYRSLLENSDNLENVPSHKQFVILAPRVSDAHHDESNQMTDMSVVVDLVQAWRVVRATVRRTSCDATM